MQKTILYKGSIVWTRTGRESYGWLMAVGTGHTEISYSVSAHDTSDLSGEVTVVMSSLFHILKDFVGVPPHPQALSVVTFMVLRGKDKKNSFD